MDRSFLRRAVQSFGGSDHLERGADHPEVRRALVREELRLEAVAEGAVEHEKLPEAVRFRIVDDRLQFDGRSEPVLAHENDYALVVLGRRPVEAEWTLRIMRVPVVRTRDDRRSSLVARLRERFPGAHVHVQREVARG
jgi:hypothetical protein